MLINESNPIFHVLRRTRQLLFGVFLDKQKRTLRFESFDVNCFFGNRNFNNPPEHYAYLEESGAYGIAYTIDIHSLAQAA